MDSNIVTIEQEVLRWPGVTSASGRFGAVAFRYGTPYQGEDLLFDPAAPGRFLVRCTRPKEAARGTCLYERLIGPATVIMRFPRDWLDQWRAVLAGIDRLITALQGAGG